MAQRNDGTKNDPWSNKRKAEEDKTARLMKKRTLYLGEVDSSSEEEMDKLDRLFPRWWEDDQHLADCECDFCKIYYKGIRSTMTSTTDGTSSTTSSSSSTGSNDGGDAAGEQHQNPSTPDAA